MRMTKSKGWVAGFALAGILGLTGPARAETEREGPAKMKGPVKEMDSCGDCKVDGVCARHARILDEFKDRMREKWENASPEERERMKEHMERWQRVCKERFRKKFDADGDGKLSPDERKTARETLEKRFPHWKDRCEDVRDHREDVRDRREDIRDHREDVRDRAEDRADKREDIWDAKHDGGKWDRIEDILDAREDVRDNREDGRDRREDVRDRREDGRDRAEDRKDRREDWRERKEDKRDRPPPKPHCPPPGGRK